MQCLQGIKKIIIIIMALWNGNKKPTSLNRLMSCLIFCRNGHLFSLCCYLSFRCYNISIFSLFLSLSLKFVSSSKDFWNIVHELKRIERPHKDYVGLLKQCLYSPGLKDCRALRSCSETGARAVRSGCCLPLTETKWFPPSWWFLLGNPTRLTKLLPEKMFI